MWYGWARFDHRNSHLRRNVRDNLSGGRRRRNTWHTWRSIWKSQDPEHPSTLASSEVNVSAYFVGTSRAEKLLTTQAAPSRSMPVEHDPR